MLGFLSNGPPVALVSLALDVLRYLIVSPLLLSHQAA